MLSSDPATYLKDNQVQLKTFIRKNALQKHFYHTEKLEAT